MELNSIFPSKYLKAADLKGHEPTVIIATAEIEKLGDDNKLILYFQGKEKGLVCNRTNADRIAYLYGTNTDNWLGKEIILYTEMVNFQGKVMEALRVKPPRARGGNGKPADMGIQGKVDLGYQLSSGPGATPVKQQSAADPDLDEIVPF